MEKIKTTLNVDKNLKKLAEKLALEEDVAFQDIVNRALYNELVENAKYKAKTLTLKPKAIDTNMGNLSRGDFYAKI